MKWFKNLFNSKVVTATMLFTLAVLFLIFTSHSVLSAEQGQGFTKWLKPVEDKCFSLKVCCGMAGSVCCCYERQKQCGIGSISVEKMKRLEKQCVPIESKKAKSKQSCRKDIQAQLSPTARELYALACKNNFSFSRSANYPYVDLGYYVKDEDGVIPLIRTGYEVALYRRLKNRLVNIEVFKPLSETRLFDETIFAVLDKDRGKNLQHNVTVNLLDVILTLHNVTRLLARPEQWFSNYPNTEAGQNRERQDQARLIFDDLLDVRSVDIYPTYFQYNRLKQFESGTMVENLFGPKGVFEFHPVTTRANDGYQPSHWNGGIHYYYWVGAIVQFVGKAIYDDLIPGTSGGPLARSGVFYYEYWQKKLQGNGLRGQTQLEHGFIPGTEWMKHTDDALDEISGLAPKLVHGGTR